MRSRYYEGVPFDHLFSHGRLKLARAGRWDEDRNRRRDEDQVPAHARPIA